MIWRVEEHKKNRIQHSPWSEEQGIPWSNWRSWYADSPKVACVYQKTTGAGVGSFISLRNIGIMMWGLIIADEGVDHGEVFC